AVVLGGGGPSTPATRRAIDATWQAVFGGTSASAAWIPGPAASVLRVHELIAGTAARRRTRGDAQDAVVRARGLVEDEVRRLRGLLHAV
ncbi:MAG: hypothetical protein ACTHJL_08355, partial [Amnibacterium sp.]